LFRDGANKPEAAISMPTHRFTDLFTEENLGEVSLLLKTRIFMKKSTGRGVYELRLIG